MYAIVDSAKSFEQASADLEAAVKRHNFGVMHIHDIGNTLRSKGQDFPHQCRVFEVCNPLQASRVMAIDLRLNMALPCRISVYSENGQTRIGMIPPAAILASLSSDPALQGIAAEVEASLMTMIQEAR